MVEPRPCATEVDIHVLPVTGGVDDHHALFVGGTTGGVCGLHIDLEADIGAAVEFEVDSSVGVGNIEIGVDGEGNVGNAVWDMHRGVALARAGFGWCIFMPGDGVKAGAKFGGFKRFENLHVGKGDGIGGGEGVETERVADGEGLVIDANGTIEGIVDKGAGNATLFNGGIEFEVLYSATVEHGDGEWKLEESECVQSCGSRLVSHHETGYNVGGIESGIYRDGVGGGGNHFDGVHVQECRWDKVLVISAGRKGC